jgi:hypothetical protein
VETWIHIGDSTHLEFGSRGENPYLTSSSSWLEERKGQLMILSAPAAVECVQASGGSAPCGVEQQSNHLAKSAVVIGGVCRINMHNG